MSTSKQQAFVEQLRAYVSDNDLQIAEERPIAHGHQFRITDGSETAVVSVYKSGKVVIGGKRSPLRQQIETWHHSPEANSPVPAPSQLQALRRYIRRMDLRVVEEREIDYGYQFKLKNWNDETCVVSLYTTGKIVVGGKNTPLKKQLQEWGNLQLAGEQLPDFTAHIGADEAGKGDYFGPLVVAAVYVSENAALDLVRWGVRDSKDMSDVTIAHLALSIRESCPNVVHILAPPEYNIRYERAGNLNHLLAELHAAAISELVRETGCRDVLVDQFANESVLAGAVAQQGIEINLQQRTRGERDVAVAAASILARESFVATIEDYRAKTELDIPLGASSPQLYKVGRAIVRKWGKNELRNLAKLHFKTTARII